MFLIQPLSRPGQHTRLPRANSWRAMILLCASLVLSSCGGGGTASDPDAPTSHSGSPVPSLPGEIKLVVGTAHEQTTYLLYAIRADQTLRVIAKTNGRSLVSVSPDGAWHVVQGDSGRSNLYDRANASVGSGPSGPQWGDSYGWTDDSRLVYYGVYFSGIYEIDTRSGSPRSVLQSKSATYDHSVAVSPDGRYIAWSHNEFGNELTVYCAERAGLPTTYAAARVIWKGTTMSADEQQQTVFIDNGRFLFAITTRDSGDSGTTKLFVGNANTGDVQVVANLPNNGIKSLALSRDRSKIAYSDQLSIYVADVGQWKLKRIDRNTDFLSPHVSWSPDARFVAAAALNFAESGPDYDSYQTQVIIYEPNSGDKWKLASVKGGTGAYGLAWGP